eukprot:14617636-Ditylum_brightwellii.AAC.1
MSAKTLEDGDLCGIIRKADITWNHRQTDGQLFRESYQDCTPLLGCHSFWQHDTPGHLHSISLGVNTETIIIFRALT